MNIIKYGVKVPWPDVGDMWVTDHGPAFDTMPLLFESQRDAEVFAQQVWGSIAKVVEYRAQ